MCRKHQMYGLCLMMLGLGLVALGMVTARRR